MKRAYYFALALITALSLWLSPGLLRGGHGSAGAQAPPEIRGAWLTNVDSQVLFSSDALEATLQTLADHHFNTVYPAMWSWGYTLFPSAVGRRATGYKQGLYPDLEDEGRNDALEDAQGDRDLLLELITAAHERHLSVIPWLEFGFMAPANSPLAARHPDWLTQKQGPWPTARLYQEGRHPRVWLNPFHPQVQQFLLDLVGELVANYEVDGIQLDDHFGLPYEFGYDPVTIDRYRQDHNGQAPPTNPRDAEWTRWRANQITEFQKRVFRVVKARRPDAVISLSPNSANTAYGSTLQDWPRWQSEGYIEELIIQAYRNDLSQFRELLQEPKLQRARQHIPTGVGILSGLKDRPVSISQIQRQVQVARNLGFAGVSFFFYDTLWQVAPGETATQRAARVRQLFPRARDRPQL